MWGGPGGGRKLGVGKHEFAFQFGFPTRVDLKDALPLRSEGRSWGYTTPHSSVEDSASVDYSLTVYVQHGKFTRTARFVPPLLSEWKLIFLQVEDQDSVCAVCQTRQSVSASSVGL